MAPRTAASTYSSSSRHGMTTEQTGCSSSGVRTRRRDDERMGSRIAELPPRASSGELLRIPCPARRARGARGGVTYSGGRRRRRGREAAAAMGGTVRTIRPAARLRARGRGTPRAAPVCRARCPASGRAAHEDEGDARGHRGGAHDPGHVAGDRHPVRLGDGARGRRHAEVLPADALARGGARARLRRDDVDDHAGDDRRHDPRAAVAGDRAHEPRLRVDGLDDDGGGADLRVVRGLGCGGLGGGGVFAGEAGL